MVCETPLSYRVMLSVTYSVFKAEISIPAEGIVLPKVFNLSISLRSIHGLDVSITQ